MTTHLARLANDHWLAAYRTLIRDVAGEWRDFGAVHAFTSGIQLHFANGCLVLEPAAAADLDDAIGWLATTGLPYRVRLDASLPPTLLEVPSRHGMVRDPERLPGMVLKPIPEVPSPAAGISIVRVSADSYAEFVDMLVATGMPLEWARRAFPPHLVDDPDTELFVARLDGVPVGTSLVMRTGDVAGIYAVGTVEAARRRGAGTAVTWAGVQTARDWGCTAVVLQASSMGYPVYLKMGFRPVVDYARFIPAATPRS